MPQNRLNQQSVLIREACSQDLARIVALDYEAFSWSNTQEDEAIFAMRLKAFPNGCFVAVVDEDVVGYCTSEKWASEREPKLGENPTETHHQHGTVLCITGFAVTKPMQQRGVGTELLAKLIETARAEQCLTILLETGDARTFYSKFGFETVGVRNQNGATMFIVRLELSQN